MKYRSSNKIKKTLQKSSSNCPEIRNVYQSKTRLSPKITELVDVLQRIGCVEIEIM